MSSFEFDRVQNHRQKELSKCNIITILIVAFILLVPSVIVVGVYCIRTTPSNEASPPVAAHLLHHDFFSFTSTQASQQYHLANNTSYNFASDNGDVGNSISNKKRGLSTTFLKGIKQRKTQEISNLLQLEMAFDNQITKKTQNSDGRKGKKKSQEERKEKQKEKKQSKEKQKREPNKIALPTPNAVSHSFTNENL